MNEHERISMDWRNRAACLDEDPELFFPVGSTGPAVEQTERAKAVCAGCDVITQCLEWALTTGQDAGVWGGKTEDERRALRRPATTTPTAAPTNRRRPVNRRH
jgi:WhiB family redox-sensing transcriptional regulator